MVASRLQRRLAHFGLYRYADYYDLVTSGSDPDEMQVLIDLLTTNETYFFREPAHFNFLKNSILSQRITAPFRVWSAACSSGEEVYSLAMILADALNGNAWEIMGSDLSSRVLQKAHTGHYSMERNEGIDIAHLKKYCLKGVNEQANTLLIDRELRSRVNFRQINLKQKLPDIGQYDVIFLRNILIYFNRETKKEVVKRVTRQLKSGGYLFISHTENLMGTDHNLQSVNPSIYRKP